MKKVKKPSQKHKDILLKFLTEKLCRVTEMYTGRPGFERFGHFFDGYTQGVKEHMGINLFDGFNYWLAQEIHPRTANVVWWGQMIDVFKTDAEAIRQFPVLYSKFLHSKEFNEFSDRDWWDYKKKKTRTKKP